MAIVWNQKVEITVGDRNRQKFRDKGYECNLGDILVVPICEALKVVSGYGIYAEVTCDYCHTVFTRKFGPVNKKKNAFCNRACHNKYQLGSYQPRRSDVVTTKCGYCNKIMHLRPSIVNKKTGINFCSYECNSASKRGVLKKVYTHMKCTCPCSYCGEQFSMDRYVYKNLMNSFLPKYCCKNCGKYKHEEMNQIKIQSLVDDVGNIEEYYQEVLNGNKKFPEGFFKYSSTEIHRKILRRFFEIAKKNGDVNSIYDFSKKLTGNFLKRYKLHAIYVEYNSLYKIIDVLFPQKYMPWELNRVPPNYWDNKENRLKAIQWFYSKLIEDKVIECEKDILSINDLGTLLKEYRLEGLAVLHFNSSTYEFWSEIFPNKFFAWEFPLTTRNYWSNKNNRTVALRELIEQYLSIEINDIPKKLTYTFLVNNFRKFAGVCDKYYKSNIYTWINEAYPNRFNQDEFHNTISPDGYRLDSIPELKIHEILLSMGCQIQYFENKQAVKEKWFNEKYDEWYVPDWIINQKYIIEYFGWYDIKRYGKYDRITKYIDKAHRKKEYFTQLEGYTFIDIYPEDLEGEYNGLLVKFRSHGLNIGALNSNARFVVSV